MLSAYLWLRNLSWIRRYVFEEEPTIISPSGRSYSKRRVTIYDISQSWGLGFLFCVLILGFLTRYNLRYNLPKALGNTDLFHNPESFIAERAWKDLKILTSFGPRPTGSYSNEILAVDFLKREIAYIKQMAHRHHQIDIDLQVTSGAFWADFHPHGMTNVYRNVQNVVVKLKGREEGIHNSSLLLNCHFDSVAGSPGASDDAGSCCVMLEILRVLSRQNTVNRHSIVFLFNGAEETPLQASHGFITQHKWAKDIKAFINLESVGSAGKEVLFQTGPQNPWLVRLYGKAAAHPNAQVAAEEVFQSGLIPSDTDFRIFRDFGNVPGLDFASVINGYRYHTKFDSIDYIPQNVLQHTGENILELTKLVANSDELSEPLKHAEGSDVFFDVLGFFFISYSKEFGNTFNYVIVSLSIVVPYIFLTRSTKGMSQHTRHEIFKGFLVNVLCFVGGNFMAVVIARFLDSNNRAMSWYSFTVHTIPLFCVPALVVHLLLHTNFDSCCSWIFGSNKNLLTINLKVQATLIGTNLFWGLLTAAITSAGYKIGYVIMVPLLINLTCSVTVGILGLQNTRFTWIFVHLIGQFYVILWSTHFYHLVLDMFIPIAGRSGGANRPDEMISIICASFTFFITSSLTPLAGLMRKRAFLFGFLLAVIFGDFVIVRFTKFGFPYCDETNGAPAVQRHFITHATRTLYNQAGEVRYTDSGFWMRELDRNAHKLIESLSAPDVPIRQEENNLCASEVFCGLPFYSSRQLHTGGFWVPSSPPLVREVASLKLNRKDRLGTNQQRLSFILSGSFLISVQIRPKETVKLTHWNISELVPAPNVYHGEKSYFVMVTHGLEAPPFNFYMDFETTLVDYRGPLVDVSVVTFYWEYHKEHTPAFASLLARLPRWVFAVPSVAALKSWTF